MVFAAVTAVAGCTAGQYGALQRDEEVTRTFSSYQVPADYRYYYAGPEGRPSAILGLRKEYSLSTTQWTEFDASSDKLKKWVDWFDDTFGMRTRHYPSGFWVKDPSGRRIGLWYSIWDWTVVIVEAGNQVMIYPPSEKELYRDPGDVKNLRRN
jgi:hypothetical protein